MHCDCFLGECLPHFISNDAAHCPAIEFLGRQEGEGMSELSELVSGSTVMFSVQKETHIRDRVATACSTRHLDKVIQLQMGNRAAANQEIKLGLVGSN